MNKEASKKLRALAEQSIARAGGNFKQALRALSKLVKRDEDIQERAIYLGLLQALRNAQNDMRTSATTEGLRAFLGKSDDAVPIISPKDADRLVGRFLYPLHRSGTFIGLATEELIIESITEIDRNVEGLLHQRKFQDAALDVLRSRRKTKRQRLIDVMTEAEIEEIYQAHVSSKAA